MRNLEVSAVALLASLVAFTPACKRRVELYCDEDTPCMDPERPFCDLNGEYPASEGIGNTCIPDPFPQGRFSIGTEEVRVNARIPDITALEVSIERAPGFDDAIVASMVDLPDGVAVDPITIAAGENGGTLRIDAAGGTAAELATVTLIGRSGESVDMSEVELFLVGTAGTPDATFGDNGEFVLDLPASTTLTNSFLQADEKLILSGIDGGEITLVRVLSSGELDRDFGTNGISHIDPSAIGLEGVTVIDTAAQSDGKIVLAGYGDADPAVDRSDRDLVLARVEADGVLDTSFGEGGLVVHPMGAADARPAAVAVTPGDQLVVAGRIADVGSTSSDFFLARFTLAGTFDISFDGDGLVTADADRVDTAVDVVVRNNGGPLLLGQATDTMSAGILLAFDALGAVDDNFGDAGRQMLPPLDMTVSVSDMLQIEDGALLVAGSGETSAGETPTLWKLSSAGEPDLSFGSAGAAQPVLQGGEEGEFGFALFPEAGKMLGVGSVGTTVVENQLLFAGFDDSGASDPEFGSEGLWLQERAETFLPVGAFEFRAFRMVTVLQELRADGGFAYRLLRSWR